MKSSHAGLYLFTFQMMMIIVIFQDVASQAVQAVLGGALCMSNMICFP